MANCRRCEHYGKQHMVDGYNDLAWLRWPCEKGVASLPDKLNTFTALNDSGFWVSYEHRKLPWMIDNHECPEFEEVE